MKIAFIHYHLKTGGVTTVLRQQVEALQDKCEILVFSGAPPQTAFPADIVLIPELGYTRSHHTHFDSQDVAERIARAILQKFGTDCDVLHVHNPTLAKNRQFLEILSALQERKFFLLLQIHDFAEDGRPLSYFKEAYPSDCHYAVINSRDYAILLKAGLKTAGLHLLPNMVNPPRGGHPFSNGGESVLYPARAIRRKNVGEAILMSLFFEDGERLVVTLPPNSPADMQSYRDWRSFVQDQQLHVEFDAGLKQDFAMLVQSAKYLITTSITEGFGFSFLEPWVYDKLLWGRKIIDITNDFEYCGIVLDHLYTRIAVPTKWFDQQELYDRWVSCVKTACRLFDMSIPPEQLKKSFDCSTADGHIDFGLLDENLQKKIILQIMHNERKKKIFVRRNPFLACPGKVPCCDQLIRANKQAVLKNYGQFSYAEKLMAAYASVSKNTVTQRIDKQILLAEFLNLNAFSLLKWCDYRE